MHTSVKPIVCITGASGFIGSHLVHELLAAGAEVRALTRHSQAPEKTAHLQKIAGDLRASERLSLHATSLEDPASYQSLLNSSDYVFHLGAPLSGSGIVADALHGSDQLLKVIANSSSVKGLAFCSSIAAVISQRRRQGHIYTESDWFNGPYRDNYASSKALAEQLVWNFATKHDHHLKTLVINPSLVIGPALAASHLNSSLKVLTDLIDGRYWGPPPCAIGLVHVHDVVRFLRLGMEQQLTGRYILNSGNLWFDEIVDILQQEFPSRTIRRNRVLAALRFALSTTKNQGFLGLINHWQRYDQVSAAKSRHSLNLDWASPTTAIRDFCASLRQFDSSPSFIASYPKPSKSVLTLLRRNALE